ncbi:MAG: transposase [Pirellulales bacterium]|nr:transposase [Pirellulales bacterium]
MLHRKRIRHVHEAGHLHELTFSCYDRLPLLTNDDWRRRLARSIDAARAECHMQLYAFVFMPEHVHLLVAPVGQGTISKFLARIKQPFSKEIKARLAATRAKLFNRLTVVERPGKTCFRFWQEGSGYDRNLYSPRAINTSIEYIHANPVARGLCRKAVDWKWSASHYLEDGCLPDPDLPLLHPLPRDALM